MKRLWMVVMAAALSCHQLSAQEKALAMGKFTDYWTVGVNGGVEVLTTHTQIAYNLNPKAGIRVGRSLTPVLGFAVQGAASFRNKPFPGSRGILKATNLDVLATVNMSNLVSHYSNQPRRVEVAVLGGLGWGHLFGLKPLATDDGGTIQPSQMDKNAFMGKAGIDLSLNIGREREWQLYLEPAISYHLDADGNVKLNINKSCIGLSVGINYRLPCSNGRRHVFYGRLRSQQEIDALNQQINELKADVKAKDAQMARDKRQIEELKRENERMRE